MPALKNNNKKTFPVNPVLYTEGEEAAKSVLWIWGGSMLLEYYSWSHAVTLTQVAVTFMLLTIEKRIFPVNPG